MLAFKLVLSALLWGHRGAAASLVEDEDAVIVWSSTGGGIRAMMGCVGFSNVFQQAGLFSADSSKFEAIATNSGGTWFSSQFFYVPGFFEQTAMAATPEDLYNFVIRWMDEYGAFLSNNTATNSDVAETLNLVWLDDIERLFRDEESDGSDGDEDMVNIAQEYLRMLLERNNVDWAAYVNDMLQTGATQYGFSGNITEIQPTPSNRIAALQETNWYVQTGLAPNALVRDHSSDDYDMVAYLSPVEINGVAANWYAPIVTAAYLVNSTFNGFVYDNLATSLAVEAYPIEKSFSFDDWEKFYLWPASDAKLTTVYTETNRNDSTMNLMADPFGGSESVLLPQVAAASSAAAAVLGGSTASAFAQVFSKVRYGQRSENDFLGLQVTLETASAMYQAEFTDDLAVCSQWPDPCGPRDARFVDGALIENTALAVNIAQYQQQQATNASKTLRVLMTNHNQEFNNTANLAMITQFFSNEYNGQTPPGEFFWPSYYPTPYQSPQMFEEYLDADMLSMMEEPIQGSKVTTLVLGGYTIENKHFGIRQGQNVEIMVINTNEPITTLIVSHSTVMETREDLARMVYDLVSNEELIRRVEDFCSGLLVPIPLYPATAPPYHDPFDGELNLSSDDSDPKQSEEKEKDSANLGWWLASVLIAFVFILVGSYQLSLGALLDFGRPTGVIRDVHELEYVAALMQTDPKELRLDGSLTAEDIALFLRSRYGTSLGASDISKELLQKGFSQLQSNDVDSNVLDLAEFVSVILIPQLIDARIGHDPVLEFVWNDLTKSLSFPSRLSDSEEIPLTTEIVRQMWLSLGEKGLANDDDLLQRMVAVPNPRCEEATQGQDSNQEKCSAKSFAKLLTNDVSLWNPDSFELMPSGKEQSCKNLVVEPKQCATDHIDFVSDKFLSLPICVAAYCKFFIAYWVFVFQSDSSIKAEIECDNYAFRGSWSDNKGAIGCGIGVQTLNWLITFLIMSTGGLFTIGATTLSNSATTSSNRFAHVLTLFCSIALTFMPFALTARFQDAGVLEAQPLTVSRYSAAFAAGVVLIVLNLAHSFGLKWWGENRFLVHGGQERQARNAAMEKSQSLIKSALRFSSNLKSHGAALAREEDQKTETVGGSRWIVDTMFSREASTVEGIWLSPRLISSTLILVLFSLFLFWGLMYTAVYTQRNYQAEEESEVFVQDVIQDIVRQAGGLSVLPTMQLSKIGRFLATVLTPFCDAFLESASRHGVDSTDSALFEVCVAANATSKVESMESFGNASEQFRGNVTYLLYRTGFDFESFAESFNAFFQSQATAATEGLYPEESYMLSVPIFFGAIVASFSGLYTALIYIPSAINRVMKYRCGIIPSLRDPNFLNIRNRNTVKLMLLNGSMVWGMLASSLISAVVFGGFIFLALWQVSVSGFIAFVAWTIGLSIANCIYILVSRTAAGKFTKGNYRTDPTKWNISSLFLESGKFAISVLFVAAKAFFALCVMVLNIGRVDIDLFPREIVPFFGGALLSMPFDAELLVHEAHRHPYIELFGCLCRAKLEGHDEFITPEGSAWRLMFVLTLMPWLRKKRSMARRKQDPVLVVETDEAVESLPSLPVTKSALNRAAEALSEHAKTSSQNSDEVEAMLARINSMIQEELVNETRNED